MKIKQDEMSVGELFKGIPDFVRVFQEIEREIKRYNCYRWNKNTTKKKLQHIFKEQLPYFEEKDFYELEIAAAGIMRNFLTISCDKYFTIDRKINRFLETTFLIYRVSDEKIKEVIDFVKQIDFEKLARLTSGKILGYIESRI